QCLIQILLEGLVLLPPRQWLVRDWASLDYIIEWKLLHLRSKPGTHGPESRIDQCPYGFHQVQELLGRVGPGARYAPGLGTNPTQSHSATWSHRKDDGSDLEILAHAKGMAEHLVPEETEVVVGNQLLLGEL